VGFLLLTLVVVAVEILAHRHLQVAMVAEVKVAGNGSK
jgi:hypothetical protein